MIRTYVASETGVERLDRLPGELPERTLWIDLLTPTEEEEDAVEAALGITLPTREKMREIEFSSRLYSTEEAVYMTASVLNNSDSERPEPVDITFVLVGQRLVTLRHETPRSFQIIDARLARERGVPRDGTAILIVILEAIVDRAADVLERIGHDLDELSHQIFDQTSEGAKARDYQNALRKIGRDGFLNSKVRESLLTLSRLVAYFSVIADRRLAKAARPRVKTLTRDIKSITDHANFTSSKMNFLLDATLGMISNEQSDIIKIFSVVAVMFVPATLIASIYGMNFEFMPELREDWGYPASLLAMILSAVLPFLYFKRRGWL